MTTEKVTIDRELLEALRRIVATPFNYREKSAIAMCDIASAAIAALSATNSGECRNEQMQ